MKPRISATRLGVPWLSYVKISGRATARNRLGVVSQYGPLWLIRPPCAAEVPEEISLFEIAEAVPVPLGSSFASDAELQRLIARVMDALNERYMLLRGCGLNPMFWHDRDEPSIARLRDLKRLRQAADELLRLGIEASNVEAYRRCFNELKGGAKSFAGFFQFRDDFASDEAGLSMLRYAALSLDESLGGPMLVATPCSAMKPSPIPAPWISRRISPCEKPAASGSPT